MTWNSAERPKNRATPEPMGELSSTTGSAGVVPGGPSRYEAVIGRVAIDTPSVEPTPRRLPPTDNAGAWDSHVRRSRCRVAGGPRLLLAPASPDPRHTQTARDQPEQEERPPQSAPRELGPVGRQHHHQQARSDDGCDRRRPDAIGQRQRCGARRIRALFTYLNHQRDHHQYRVADVQHQPDPRGYPGPTVTREGELV